MKSILLALLALAAGAGLAFALFAMTFNAPVFERPLGLLAPALLALGASATLGLLDSARWVLQAVLLAAPTVLMCALITTMLAFEQRWAAAWIALPAVVLVLCLAGALAGRNLARRAERGRP